jgi:hypothetical protein
VQYLSHGLQHIFHPEGTGIHKLTVTVQDPPGARFPMQHHVRGVELCMNDSRVCTDENYITKMTKSQKVNFQVAL